MFLLRYQRIALTNCFVPGMPGADEAATERPTPAGGDFWTWFSSAEGEVHVDVCEDLYSLAIEQGRLVAPLLHSRQGGRNEERVA